MTYRLDQRDEGDVRYLLGDDVRGDVGVRSSASSFEARSIYAPIVNFPWLKCGPIRVTAKKPHYVEHELGGKLVRLSERDTFLQAIWNQVGPADRDTLERCYSGYRLLPHFEVFGDIAPLVCDTGGALVVEQRERAHTRIHLSRLEAMVSFAGRIDKYRSPNTPDPNQRDLDLFNEIEIEADHRLSQACRHYTALADAARERKEAA
jgi:hypothetical protein